jgi:hypothetical protein
MQHSLRVRFPFRAAADSAVRQAAALAFFIRGTFATPPRSQCAADLARRPRAGGAGDAVEKKDLVVVTALLLAVLSAAGWFHEHRRMSDAQLRVNEVRHLCVAATLTPVVAMLKQNTDSSLELQSAQYSEAGAGFVAAYLIKIRRDGILKHSDMKGRIDQIVANDTAILALLGAHAAHSRTAAFKESARQFREYASRLRELWQSIPEVFAAGDKLPDTALQYPAELEAAVVLEIAAS